MCRSEREIVQVRQGVYIGQRGSLYRSVREVVQVRQGVCTGQREVMQIREVGSCSGFKGRLCRLEREFV